MSLLKTMMMGVLSLIILVFLGTYFITLNNDKNYFVAQMQSNAQDTATSLGLSLSHAMKDNDKLTTLSMVQAVFDRGYFSSILVNDIEGKTIVSRFRANSNEIVPRWFISFLDLKLVPASALVMSGWNQMGEVLVTTDINYVYEALWKNAEGLFLWYLFFAILSISLVIFFIKWLLRPLQRVTAQALSICNREFPIEQNIPKSLELKQVTTAMNKMVRKLKRIFSEQLQQATQLREDAFIDSLTGLFNRRFFLQQLSSLIAQTDDFTPGIVGVIAIQGLDALNHVKGYVEGDNLIQEISAELKILNEKNERLICSRVGGSQFTFLYQSPPLDFVSETVQNLKATLNKIALKYEAIKIHIAFIPYISGATVSDTLTTMDKALHGVISDVVAEPSYSLPAQVSLPLLKKAIEEHEFILFKQAIKQDLDTYHEEILVRMKDESESIISPGHFIPLAEQHHLMAEIDFAVLNQIIQSEHLNTHKIALNINQQTFMHKPDFTHYMDILKKVNKRELKNLSIEFHETNLITNLDSVKEAVHQLKMLGLSIGVDNVGISFAPLHYMNDLSIDYVKLHGSYTHHVDDNQSKQFFIHYFNEMAETMEIKVIATQVESQSDWERLNRLNIHYGQGRYLAPVEKL